VGLSIDRALSLPLHPAGVSYFYRIFPSWAHTPS
jgi:hypothetical protein